MDEKFDIAAMMMKFLLFTTEDLRAFLEPRLIRIDKDWWENCVIPAIEKGEYGKKDVEKYTSLNQMDLALLLKVLYHNWYALCDVSFLCPGDKSLVNKMHIVRNRWMHMTPTLPSKDVIISDIDVIIEFNHTIGCKEGELYQFRKGKELVNNELSSTFSVPAHNGHLSDVSLSAGECAITVGTMVHLKSNPDKHGPVIRINIIQSSGSDNSQIITKYTVYLDGKERNLYAEQVEIDNTSSVNWITASKLINLMTAYQINNPKNQNLYSLNTARIDFIPYQFRPVLKIIHSDVPRLLIADSVGVGKTIEAGLIIKELEARGELNSVLVICPKPLVAEHKWEEEMRRFDEDFTQMDGPMFRNAISDACKQGVWPEKYNKIIVPYSILDARVYEGETDKRGKKVFSLTDIDNPPSFDLVIVDEAHHIRNGSMESEGAYGYKCVKYFCDAANAVVMLTATPIQTSSDDLYTLLNVLRSDIVMDKDSFNAMSRPNQYISKALSITREHKENWQQNAMSEIAKAIKTQWGEDVLMSNPNYNNVIRTLDQSEITSEERIRLQGNIESLNSFYGLMSRTRRKDIQDFCVRSATTERVRFTNEQQDLYDALLEFEKAVIFQKYGDARYVSFLTSTLKRRAASCIFGIAPFIREIIDRGMIQISSEEADIDNEEEISDLFSIGQGFIDELAVNLLNKAENLSGDDPKLDVLLRLIEQKQCADNKKIMIFSTFINTLTYLYDHISDAGYRVGIIIGKVADDERAHLRDRFMDEKTDDRIDIMLFSEVGSEGLDYQFCNMMINYDIPWNPMKIEQRIGRIDRKGQQSEKVNIYNIVTEGTIDADIYDRCLCRIGIFENNVGDCDIILGDVSDVILGELSRGINQICMSETLTEEERKYKLEQLADIEKAHIQENEKIEKSEADFCGVDVSEFITSSQISSAENAWIMPSTLRELVESYFNDVLGEGKYLSDEKLISLKLSPGKKQLLLTDYKKLNLRSNSSVSAWGAFLGNNMLRAYLLTFDSECAKDNPKAAYINVTHPLIRQAASHYKYHGTAQVYIRYTNDILAPGRYYFSVYSWEYMGYKPRTVLKVVSTSEDLTSNFEQIILTSSSCDSNNSVDVDESIWDSLENIQHDDLAVETENFRAAAENISRYRTSNLTTNHQNKVRWIQQRLASSENEKIIRMYEAELKNDDARYLAKLSEIQEELSHSDIQSDIFVNGIIDVEA